MFVFDCFLNRWLSLQFMTVVMCRSFEFAVIPTDEAKVSLREAMEACEDAN